MSEIEVGEYVRTIDGKIDKIIEIANNYVLLKSKIIISEYGESHIFIKKADIVKHSPNIIDLIEKGDYVNGYKVDDIENGKLIIGNTTQVVEQIVGDNEDIKTIVTKEQFNSVMYKVGDIE